MAINIALLSNRNRLDLFRLAFFNGALPMVKCLYARQLLRLSDLYLISSPLERRSFHATLTLRSYFQDAERWED